MVLFIDLLSFFYGASTSKVVSSVCEYSNGEGLDVKEGFGSQGEVCGFPK